MTSQRCLYRDLRGLFVTNLTDEYHVRVLTQYRAEGRREVETRLYIYLNLYNPCESVLYRIFDRHDVDAFTLHMTDSRVECGGFSATRGTVYQQQSIGSIDTFL